MSARWSTTRWLRWTAFTAKARARSRSGGSSFFQAEQGHLVLLEAEPPAELIAAAEATFGERLPLAVQYAALLMSEGVVRGLIGPREGERIWQRHLLNSAAVAGLVSVAARVVDVGSGAGLPGIPVALCRPGCAMVLLEPMARRCAFLEEAVGALGLGQQVRVIRGRAPESRGELPFLADYALARAVAPLERLVSWTMPIVQPGGELLALRGERARQELQEVGHRLAAHGAGAPRVTELGGDLLGAPVRVVRVPRSEGRKGFQGGGSRRGGRVTRRFT